MKETPEHYTARMLALAGHSDPRTLLAATGERIARLLDGLSLRELRRRPVPDKWAIVEILAHLADCEVVTSWRIRQVLGAPGTIIQAFDQNAWAIAGHYAERDADRSLGQFRALRAVNSELLSILTPDQWKLQGIHAERGPESIEHLVRMLAGHDLNHLAQIAAIASATGR